MRVSIGDLKRYISRTLIIEGRIDDVREKYPDIEEDDWQSLVGSQPAGSNNKYLMWCAGQVNDGFSVEVVVQTIRLFHGTVARLSEKDINKYEDVGAVEKAIEELPAKKTKSQEQKQAKADTDKIYEDDEWLVVRPHTKDASCKYGASTKWCIAATASRNYFSTYSESNNKFYFVIDKNATPGSPNSKFAIAIIAAGNVNNEADRIQVYDASDKLVDMNVVATKVGSKWSSIWQKILQHVASNPTTREVDDARKSLDDSVKDLLSGKKLSQQLLDKIAAQAELTPRVVDRLVDSFSGYPVMEDYYGDERSNIMTSLSNRSTELQPESAAKVLKWMSSNRPAGKEYWAGDYSIRNMLRGAQLTPEVFDEFSDIDNEIVLSTLYNNPSAPKEFKEKIASKVQDWQSLEAVLNVYMSMIKSGVSDEKFVEILNKTFSAKASYYSFAERGQSKGESRIFSALVSGNNERITPNQFRLLFNFVEEKSPGQLDFFAFKKFIKLPNFPSDVLVAFLNKIIANKNYEEKELFSILSDAKFDISVVEDIWTKNKQPSIRAALLQNPSIGEENASKFAKSTNSAYRFSVAHNEILPKSDLTQLANDESVSTRSAVAANKNTPTETLEKLAKDEAIVVRASVASNVSAPSNLLLMLKKDSESIVRRSATQALKARGASETTESLLRRAIKAILTEALDDGDDSGTTTQDIMHPHWTQLKYDGSKRFLGQLAVEFFAIFLLQNNGHATLEEITDAFQMWKGDALSSSSLYNDVASVRAITSMGKGYFWAPPGIKKGALFRLTPAGAAYALKALAAARSEPRSYDDLDPKVTSANAVPGRTYYMSRSEQGSNITGYKDGELVLQVVAVNRNGDIKFNDGKVQKISSRYSTGAAEVLKHTDPSGNVRYVKMSNLVKTYIPINTPVQFVKLLYGAASQETSNKAIVKYLDDYYIVQFPLWVNQNGAKPTTPERHAPPPIKKSPPQKLPAPKKSASQDPSSDTPQQPENNPAPRGPKVGYKIYGKKAGRPAHTRLKGKAYGAPADTSFTPGEQAEIQASDDGKLKVKKIGSDHTQAWDPIDG